MIVKRFGKLKVDEVKNIMLHDYMCIDDDMNNYIYLHNIYLNGVLLHTIVIGKKEFEKEYNS